MPLPRRNYRNLVIGKDEGHTCHSSGSIRNLYLAATFYQSIYAFISQLLPRSTTCLASSHAVNYIYAHPCLVTIDAARRNNSPGLEQSIMGSDSLRNVFSAQEDAQCAEQSVAGRILSGMGCSRPRIIMCMRFLTSK